MKKKGFLIALAVMLCATPAGAAEWKEGLGPEKPYSGVPEVDLSETMGYIMLYPRVKMPAEHFCDVLEMYLPREDVERGTGSISLYDEDGLVSVSDFANEDEVTIRPLTDTELEGLMWGSGVCISVQLPVSLSFEKNYYVLTDEGCFTAAGGAVTSLAISSDQAWIPVVSGDFGISGLAYRKPVEPTQTQESPAAQETEEEVEPLGEPTLTPEAGDTLSFDVIVGGDAVSAVVYSENNSVSFPELEFTENARVEGTIVGEDEISWGIVFLNTDGDILDVLSAKK